MSDYNLSPDEVNDRRPSPPSQVSLDTLCDIIRRRTGIVVKGHQLTDLSDAAVCAARHFGFKNTSKFIDFIDQVGADSMELEFIISAITVGESYFFRDMEQLEFIKDQWLPHIVEMRRNAGNKTLRIWSAGTSNGQELYTLAILLREAIEDIHAWKIHLLGTDINTEALGNCARGRYGEWSFHSTGESIKTKYFTHEGMHLTVCPELKKMVNVSYLNLADNHYPSLLNETTAIDLILCRNVFLYLDQEIVGEIMDRFTASLSDGGVLLLGASDHAIDAAGGLNLSHYSNIPYFRKCVDKETGGGEAAVVSGSFDDITTLDSKGEWTALIRVVDEYIEEHGPSERLFSMKAKALVSTGDLKGALKACRAGVDADPSGKHSYFIMALVFIEMERLEEALGALKKVIYLDPYFIEAHFQIGMLQLRNGKEEAGIKSLKNALKIVETGEPERFIHTSPEMTYSRFIEVIKSEIKIYDK